MVWIWWKLCPSPRCDEDTTLMLLAGDIGGTKTLLGLFHPSLSRPKAITIRTYQTNNFSSFSQLLDAFQRDVSQPLPIEAIVFGDSDFAVVASLWRYQDQSRWIFLCQLAKSVEPGGAHRILSLGSELEFCVQRSCFFAFSHSIGTLTYAIKSEITFTPSAATRTGRPSLGGVLVPGRYQAGYKPLLPGRTA
mgnify:CR=1 FL=1